jgi:hypothetical protein
MSFSLFLTNGREGLVLEPPDGGLEQLEIHDRRTVVVLALRLLHVGAVDSEVGDAAAVHTADLDAGELAPAGEREGTQEEIVGADHERGSPPAAARPMRLCAASSRISATAFRAASGSDTAASLAWRSLMPSPPRRWSGSTVLEHVS